MGFCLNLSSWRKSFFSIWGGEERINRRCSKTPKTHLDAFDIEAYNFTIFGVGSVARETIFLAVCLFIIQRATPFAELYRSFRACGSTALKGRHLVTKGTALRGHRVTNGAALRGHRLTKGTALRDHRVTKGTTFMQLIQKKLQLWDNR